MKIMIFCPPLLHPKLDRDTMRISAPLAIYHLGGILKNAGYDVDIRDPVHIKKYYNNTWDESLIDEFIADYDVIGISTNSFNWGIAKEFIDIVKSRQNSPFIVCGGVHVSLFSEHVMKTTRVDAVVCQDGEIALLELIKCIEEGRPFNDIPNLVYRSKDTIKINEINLQKKLPQNIPLYELIPDNYYYSLPVETSRGCPFDCAFCAILYLRKWRTLEVEEAFKRIESALPFLKDKTTANSILFTDDEFNINPERSEILLKYLEECPTPFKCHFTARITDFLHNSTLAKFIPQSKISTIQMGIECGYEEGLKKVKQGLAFEDIELSLQRLQEENLSRFCLLSFIVGFPWETVKECEKTIEYSFYIEEKYNAVTIINWWMPLKCQLWDEQKKRGFYIDANTYDDPLWPANRKVLEIVHPNISYDDIMGLNQKYGNVVTHLLDMV